MECYEKGRKNLEDGKFDITLRLNDPPMRCKLLFYFLQLQLIVWHHS